MAFNDKIKREAREKSGNRCCICRQKIVQRFHHIEPFSEGGDNSLENCMPLCPSCHADAHNTEYNKEELRKLRDTWFRCVKKNWNEKEIEKDVAIADQLIQSDTKAKIDAIYNMVDKFKMAIDTPEPNPKKVREALYDMGTAVIATTSHVTSGPLWYSESFNKSCPHCGTIFDGSTCATVTQDGDVLFTCPGCYRTVQ